MNGVRSSEAHNNAGKSSDEGESEDNSSIGYIEYAPLNQDSSSESENDDWGSSQNDFLEMQGIADSALQALEADYTATLRGEMTMNGNLGFGSEDRMSSLPMAPDEALQSEANANTDGDATGGATISTGSAAEQVTRPEGQAAREPAAGMPGHERHNERTQSSATEPLALGDIWTNVSFPPAPNSTSEDVVKGEESLPPRPPSPLGDGHKKRVNEIMAKMPIPESAIPVWARDLDWETENIQKLLNDLGK